MRYNNVIISIIKDVRVTIIDIWHMVDTYGYHIMNALQVEVCLLVTAQYAYINTYTQ